MDALTGPLIGRPKSATYRTADVVGLDTLGHVINTMKETLPNDPWHKYFDAPDWYRGLLEQGALGQKTGRGVYRKQGKEIQVLDLATRDYRLSGAEADAGVVEILKTRDVAEHFAKLRQSPHPQAQFLWAGVPRHAALLRVPAGRHRGQRARSRSSRCAGASAGTRGRSRSGRPRDGSAWRRGSPKTSRPARRWPTCRCRHG